ncbi:hypothetical protein B0H17DRAFT_1138519 [Mycena rosella]|uniref:Uncharacterized protein n=1 Tax=Mycena rosella TaxID=1033263 RepID=A0AAD7GED1_MYCRO|nr:hypothetical protein B0H17DRAFT_1138519 [Mycena rosella]
MWRPKFSPVTGAELSTSDDGSINSRDEDFPKKVRGSPVNWPGMKEKVRRFSMFCVYCLMTDGIDPKKSPLGSFGDLRLLSFVLHTMLVMIHLILIGIWARALEHRLIFSLDHQKIISPLITGITTTFGTSLEKTQPLTVTHDTAAAWVGIGSALLHVWHQKAVPASIMGVLSTFLYLGNIQVYHIATASLFSLETFTASHPNVVRTQSLPAFNDTAYDLTTAEGLNDGVFAMAAYAGGSLHFFPSVVGSTTNPGLYDGTLYDVPLDTTGGIDNITVSAIGFKVTCGYLPNVDLQFSPDDGYWRGTLDGANHLQFGIAATRKTSDADDIDPDIFAEPGIISKAGPVVNSSLSLANGTISVENTTALSVILYSTIPIVDSSYNPGPWVNLTTPMNTSVTAIQVFQCSLALVVQSAILDAQSQQVFTVTPDITKTNSTWAPYAGPQDRGGLAKVADDNLFIDMWGAWYNSMPASDFPLHWGLGASSAYASVADIYLIQNLNLPAANNSDTRSVPLHMVENSLSTIVASMFWTCVVRPNGTLQTSGINAVPSPPLLLAGNATITKVSAEARLNISVGLATSIALVLLSLPYSLSKGAHREGDLSIRGTGMLHTIWVYRNHPELETLLEQVQQPTDDNLREAGMVRTRLVDGYWRKRTSRESF